MVACAETFADVGSNVSSSYEGFSLEDGNNMEIPMMYSQGLTHVTGGHNGRTT